MHIKKGEGNSIKKEMQKFYNYTVNNLQPKGANNFPIVMSKLNLNIFLHYLDTHRKKKSEYSSLSIYVKIRTDLTLTYKSIVEEKTEYFQNDI